MGEFADFENNQRKREGIGCIVFFAIVLIAAVIFFAGKEFRTAGIFRSGKNSDATSVYQIFPLHADGKYFFISVEGVFKTKIYERKGGMTNRSGSTDIRMSVYDLATGELIKRKVNGDFHKNNLKIIGFASNVLWVYDAEHGLQSRSIPSLEIITTEDQIISSNPDLQKGIAHTDSYLRDIDALFSISESENKLFVTTVEGKQIWISSDNFQTTAPPEFISNNKSGFSELLPLILESKNQNRLSNEGINNLIKLLSSPISSSSFSPPLSSSAVGIDSCTYSLEGETIQTIKKSNCPEPPIIISTKKEASSLFIEPAFLSSKNPETQNFENPGFLHDDTILVFHASKLGDNPELRLSKIAAQSQSVIWDVNTPLKLSNHRSAYSLDAYHQNGDTLFISLSSQMLAYNLRNGKLFWEHKIETNPFHQSVLCIGFTEQNQKTFILYAYSKFIELSRSGIYVSGRTDYALQCADAKTGKILKTLSAEGNKGSELPFYLGSNDGKNWFYSEKDGIHSRTLPDLKMETSFETLTKNFPEKISLVKTTSFGQAVSDNYILFDKHHHRIYFTNDNGLHYALNTADLSIHEVQEPNQNNATQWKLENSSVSLYSNRLYNSYHHDILLNNGARVSFSDIGNLNTLNYQPNENTTSDTDEKKLVSDSQFIQAQFLMQAISIDANTIFTSQYHTPLLLNSEDKNFYLYHKNLISPDAHSIISKFNLESAEVLWKFDLNEIVPPDHEILRAYTFQNSLIILIKSSPDLDDVYTCISIEENSGTLKWKFNF